MSNKNSKKPFSKPLCAFCGKSAEDVGFLIEGNALGYPVCICAICHNTCGHIFTYRTQGEKKKFVKSFGDQAANKAVPRKIKEYLDLHVIGQDAAKMALSIAVSNHYKRIYKSQVQDKNLKDTIIEKSNVLFVGSTGSGKTLLIKTLAKYLNIPLAIGDATCLTEAGYVGEDVESLISNLYRNSDGDVKKTQIGIIYIDEIDKIAKSRNNLSITKDVSGEGVQQSLLKIIEGTICNIAPQGGRKHPEQKFVQIDTTNILFICGGTFVGIEDLIEKRNGRSMGFAKFQQEKSDLSVLPEDLIFFGMIPEFIGRFPLIQKLELLQKSDLVKILQEPKNSLVNQYKKIFLYDNVRLEFSSTALDLIAEHAIKLETGARGLKQIIERVLFDYNFNIDLYKNKTILIDTEDIEKIFKKTA